MGALLVCYQIADLGKGFTVLRALKRFLALMNTRV